MEGEQREESKGEASLHWQKQLFQILLPVGAFHHSTKRFLSLQIHFFILKKRQIEQPNQWCGFGTGIKAG